MAPILPESIGSSGPAQRQNGAGREAGGVGAVEAAEKREMRRELTLDVWLENKKFVQSPGTEASLPICPLSERLCPTLFLGLWPDLYKAQAPGRED